MANNLSGIVRGLFPASWKLGNGTNRYTGNFPEVGGNACAMTSYDPAEGYIQSSGIIEHNSHGGFIPLNYTPTFTASSTNTFEVWYKHKVTGATQHLVTAYNAGGKYMLFYVDSANRIYCGMNTTNTTMFQSSNTLVGGQWYHIVATKNATAWAAWINGVEIGYLFHNAYDGGSYAFTATFNMAGLDISNTNRGQFGMACIYNEAFDQARVSANFANGVTGGYIGNASGNTMALTEIPTGVTVTVDNSAIYWSRDNVKINGSTSAELLCGGAYFKTKFSGTSIDINIDVSAMVGASYASASYPIVRHSVDGGAYTSSQLTPATTKISITGLASGTHSIKFEVESIDVTSDWWTAPITVVKITSLFIGAGESVSSPSISSRNIRFDGDSITAAFFVDSAASAMTSHDASKSYARLIADRFGLEYTQLAYGGLGFAKIGSGAIPAYNTSQDYYYNGASRLAGGFLKSSLNFWLIALGTGDYVGTTDITGIVKAKMESARTEAGINCKIIIMIPPAGYYRTEIAAEYDSYVSAHPTDKNVALIDLGVGFTFAKNDTYHPSAAGQIAIADALQPILAQLFSTASQKSTFSLGFGLGFK